MYRSTTADLALAVDPYVKCSYVNYSEKPNTFSTVWGFVFFCFVVEY